MQSLSLSEGESHSESDACLHLQSVAETSNFTVSYYDIRK